MHWLLLDQPFSEPWSSSLYDHASVWLSWKRALTAHLRTTKSCLWFSKAPWLSVPWSYWRFCTPASPSKATGKRPTSRFVLPRTGSVLKAAVTGRSWAVLTEMPQIQTLHDWVTQNDYGRSTDGKKVGVFGTEH